MLWNREFFCTKARQAHRAGMQYRREGRPDLAFRKFVESEHFMSRARGF